MSVAGLVVEGWLGRSTTALHCTPRADAQAQKPEPFPFGSFVEEIE